MNSNSFRMTARRIAVTAAATALAAGPAVLAGAGTAHATGGHGSAGATVLRTGLDVALLDKTAEVPLAVTLNEVHAPQSAEKTLLTAELKGVHHGKPFTVARADVASAKAAVTEQRAEGAVTLVKAKVHVPGLPLLSLIEVEKVTSKAVCETGKEPVASANVLGTVTVLGKKVTLTAAGTTEVEVEGVGTVRLDLSRTDTTTHTAAATALELKVSVEPRKLNVAKVDGTVTLAEATCEAPAAAGGAGVGAEGPDDGSGGSRPDDGAGGETEKPGGAPGDEQQSGAEQKSGAGQLSAADQQAGADQAGGDEPQGEASGAADLAETGGSSMTPYIAGGAVALLAAGGGAVALARRSRG
ncbi:SCO1860 family LAETG-anchored protein [Streptomyces poonensis]|uniref:LPXTG cell wall anchor domain-containing protein n=1 Tax=Streptomyces poonensis TaxID=68255 RepID=A0A918Q734_9ACTN|nr:SCO1860 family LAETG-anchored protein [Streptomyces poonensis]GGZ34018.1 LPXTG cell wall anchor domain-containing protein [Streptomyces poonensis]GLJ89244.1 LPXTG cell wall anchor domain-containing protein [Streptomyces poonensis]